MCLRTVIALVILNSCGAFYQAAAQSRPVTISSLEGSFVSRGFFGGRVEVYPESLVVVFDSTFRQQTAAAPGRSAYHLDSLSVGLATGTGGEGWRLYRVSAALPVADSLAEQPVFSLGSLRFRVSRASGPALSESWIVVTFFEILSPSLVPRSQQGEGTTYAHSSRGVFAGLN